MKVTVMPETATNPAEIPVYLQALLNIIAFLIAATAVWYAYFVKGKGEARGGESVPPFANGLKRIGDDLFRIANAAEHIHEILKRDADEAEIERRVKERLERELRRKNDD